MQPGPTSNSNSYFPYSWLGKWKSPDGRVLEIENLGNILEVSLRAGENHPPYPVPGMPGQVSEAMPARFHCNDRSCHCLEVSFAEPGIGNCYCLEFWVAEGEQVRPASKEDDTDRLLLMPKVRRDPGTTESPTEFSWAYPLLNFKKI